MVNLETAASSYWWSTVWICLVSPQGTVLSPLMFLVYINDISGGISSNIRLFADDCILYRIIKEKHDQDILQADINLSIKWSEIWQTTFNASKCVVLRCSRLQTTLYYDYYINGTLLQLVSKHPYLGVLFDSTMSFRSAYTTKFF